MRRKTQKTNAIRDDALKAELQHLREQLRQSMIERVIDLQVAAGTIQQNEREQKARTMADPNDFPVAALECMREAILPLLVKLNQPKTQTNNENAAHHSRGYIQ